MPDSAPLDLDRYFRRIDFSGDRAPTLATLARLHLAHATAIPFENLDVRLGRPIALDLASLEAKLVARRRGGYCFEQNSLFVAVLRALGFEVDTLEARVRPPGATSTLARTHMTLRVRLAAGDRLADVGFGAGGPLLPVPLDGTSVEVAGEAHRVEAEPEGVRVLRRFSAGAWADLYAIQPLPVLPIDYVLANHYTSTHPDSTFVRALTVQRSTLEARHVLRGRTYTLQRGAEVERRELDEREVYRLLRDTMGLDVNESEVRAALGDPASAA